MLEDHNTADGPIRKLLIGMIDAEASDLHLVSGYKPTYRVHGKLQSVGETTLTPDITADWLQKVTPAPLADRFATDLNLEFSIPIDIGGQPHRFRASIFRAAGAYCGCFRHIPTQVPSFEWMGFPSALAEMLASTRNGLVLVTGVTGSGKSTTLASIVNLMNQRGGYRIITVEQPIEYMYQPTDACVISQREVGTDCASFYDGLKYGLRQDPDVILVGEIRAADTAQMALTAAETGHLILSTMHTKDARGAVTRFVDLFSARAQDDVRTLLALNLRAVVAQHLLPGPTPQDRRALAIEVMHVNLPVRAAIGQGKMESIDTAIQTGVADGMIRFDDSIERLAMEGRITPETARRFARNPNRFGGR